MVECSRLVLLVLACTALVAAQTFQYSRGWTNGRKRGGVPLLLTRPAPGRSVARAASLAAAAALLEEAGLLLPGGCLQPDQEAMQRLFHSLLEARQPPQLLQNQEWKEDATMTERRRRDTTTVASEN